MKYYPFGYIYNQGVANHPNKIAAIVSSPIPTRVIEYLGHIGYYYRIIIKYSVIALPLTK